MAWRIDTVSSKRPSENRREPTVLDRLAEDLPTTSRDIQALRRARGRNPEAPLERLDLLTAPDWVPRPTDRTTAEGWEPFEL